MSVEELCCPEISMVLTESSRNGGVPSCPHSNMLELESYLEPLIPIIFHIHLKAAAL